MANVKVPCTPPLLGHKGPITEIELREPNLGDVFELGDPWAYSRTVDGEPFQTEITSTVQAYLRRCLVTPTDILVVEQASLKTAYAVKNALLGFFLRGGSEAADSQTSETTSG